MKQNHETITVNTKILKMGGVALWLTEGLAIHEIQYVNFLDLLSALIMGSKGCVCEHLRENAKKLMQRQKNSATVVKN